MRVRRLTLTLKEPTRDGETALHILSHVPTQRASAAHLARLYGKRWSIETAFFEITTPGVRAQYVGVSQGGIVDVWPGVVGLQRGVIIKAALRSAHGRQKIHDEVSSYSLP